MYLSGQLQQLVDVTLPCIDRVQHGLQVNEDKSSDNGLLHRVHVVAVLTHSLHVSLLHMVHSFREWS